MGDNDETNESLSETLTEQYGMVDMSSEYISNSAGTKQNTDEATPLIESSCFDSGAYASLSNTAPRGLLRGLSKRLANAHAEDFQLSKKITRAESVDESIGIDHALQSDEGSDDEMRESVRSSEELLDNQNET
jgi:hypothetical protein